VGVGGEGKDDTSLPLLLVSKITELLVSKITELLVSKIIELFAIHFLKNLQN